MNWSISNIHQTLKKPKFENHLQLFRNLLTPPCANILTCLVQNTRTPLCVLTSFGNSKLWLFSFWQNFHHLMTIQFPYLDRINNIIIITVILTSKINSTISSLTITSINSWPLQFYAYIVVTKPFDKSSPIYTYKIFKSNKKKLIIILGKTLNICGLFF